MIKLWELPTEELKRHGGKGILPLLPLTREGRRREVLDEVIEGLRPHNEKSNKELLALAHGLTALAFDDPEDQSWIRRRFAMLKDILDDTWAYRELKEEALLKGRQEGELKGILKGRKEALIIIVQARFPALVQLAEERCVHIQDPAQLQNLMQQLILVPDADEAQHILLTAGGQ